MNDPLNTEAQALVLSDCYDRNELPAIHLSHVYLNTSEGLEQPIQLSTSTAEMKLGLA